MSVQRVTMVIDSNPTDVRVAREFAARVAHHLFPRSDVDLLRLLVSEIVGNAVSLEAGPIEVTLRPTVHGEMRVEVRDDGWGQPEVSPIHVLTGAGMGLQMVDRMAVEWGVDQFLPGKIVWFVV